MNLTYLQLVEKVLENTKRPMSVDEIWNKWIEFWFDKQLSSIWKTPTATLWSRLYTDIKQDKSIFEIVSKRPTLFFMKKMINLNWKIIEKIINENIEKEVKTSWNERDLHPIFVKYAFENLKLNLKTIFHEESKKTKKWLNEWLHPDLVWVYFPFWDYEKTTIDFQEYLSINSTKIFSFELKKQINFSNIRQAFFQAVSNSSWANEWYLVAVEIDSDLDFQQELKRLNNAFGIWIIRLNPININDSEVLFSSKFNSQLDLETINRLVEENDNFRDFLKNTTQMIKIQKTIKDDFDNILSDEALEKHIKDKKF